MLGRDVVLPCRDSALFLGRDDVATKVSLSRPRPPRKEVRCRTLLIATKFGLGEDFSVVTEYFMSRQSLVKVKGFSIMTEYVYVTTGFGLSRSFYVAIEFGQGQGFLYRDRVCYVTTGFGLGRSFYVVTKYVYVATGLSRTQRFSVATVWRYLASRQRRQGASDKAGRIR